MKRRGQALRGRSLRGHSRSSGSDENGSDEIEYVVDEDCYEPVAYEDGFPPYVSVKEQRKKADAVRESLSRSGRKLDPITISGRNIADHFWGKAWCRHFERYVNYENRLPRGRSYLRNGCVLDLEIEPGVVRGLVQGGELYDVEIKIEPLSRKRWLALVDSCAAEIDSAVALLSGELSDGVLTKLTDPKQGLLPKPSKIKVSCTCPDYADFCKHIAAVLYGIGAKLDKKPEVFFQLRSVSFAELVKSAADDFLRDAVALAKGIDPAEIEELFGIELNLEG